MNRAELEDLVRLHNEQIQKEFDSLHMEWIQLRSKAFDTFDPALLKDLKWKCDALRTRMDKLISERVELKESA